MGCWAGEIEIGLLIALDRIETVRIVVYDKAKGCVEYNSSNHYKGLR